MLVQRIKSGIRTGKTELLISIARGASEKGFKVLFITPTKSFSQSLQEHRKVTFCDVKSWDEVLRSRFFYRYNFILLDDVERMPQEEGDPVAVCEHSMKAYTKPFTIIGAYGTLDLQEAAHNLFYVFFRDIRAALSKLFKG
jgi:hypothetical protein